MLQILIGFLVFCEGFWRTICPGARCVYAPVNSQSANNLFQMIQTDNLKGID